MEEVEALSQVISFQVQAQDFAFLTP